MKQVATGSLLFLAGLGLCACLAVGGEESQAEYTLSSDPEEVVLQLLSSGGSSRYVYETSLYGDGRLVKTVSQGGVIRSWDETELEYVEMEDLFRIVVEGDLMEWRREDYDQKIRDSLDGHRPTPSSDVPMQRITIRLDEYRSRQGVLTSPAEIRIDTSPPRFLKSANPGLDVKEVDALFALSGAIEAFEKRAKEKGS